MSSICGLINFDGAPVNSNLLREMVKEVSYQGPDGIQYWIDGHVGLANLAFNTTPESLRERQPLLSSDEMVCITADARVDNRQELMAILSGHDERINRSATDVDLILAAYQHWGEACPVHITGDFAFAIWDKRKQQLFCARDVFGMKPLVYSKIKDTFCFASQAEQLLQHPAVPCRLDEFMVARYLASDFGGKSRTFFEGISTIPVAHSLIVRSDQLLIESYWNPKPENDLVYKNDDEYTEHFKELFKQAVNARLRSNFPVIGVQLSGGLDSSSITGMASHVIRDQETKHLLAMTTVYDQLKSADERGYSSTVAQALNIDHALLPNDDISFITNIDDPVLESPHRRWEGTEQKMINRLREQGGQVLLTGVGGDDMLLGSPLRYADQIRRGNLLALRQLRRDAIFNNESFLKIIYTWFLQPILPGPLKRLKKPRQEISGTYVPPWIREDFANRTELRQRLKSDPPIKIKSWARQATYMSAMRAGPYFQLTAQWLSRLAIRQKVEYRHPYFDKVLVEFVLRLPPDQLWRDGYSKCILRRSMSGLLPDNIRLRSDKTYYSDVFHHCLRIKDTVQISRLLENPITAKLGFIDKQKLQEVLPAYRAGQEGNQVAYALMQILNLEYWLIYYQDEFCY